MNRLTQPLKTKPVVSIHLSFSQLMIIFIIFLLISASKYIITSSIILFIAFILASLIRQSATWLYKVSKGKISQKVGILIVFIFYIVIFWGSLILLFNQIIIQSFNLISQLFTPENIQTYIITPLKRLLPFLINTNITNAITSIAGNLLSLQGPLAGAKGIASILPYVILVFLAAWYIANDLDLFLNKIDTLLNNSYQKILIKKIIIEVNQKVGNWAKAQLLLMLIIGLLTFIILNIIHLPYALLLATIAGFLEIIPNLGPTIAAIPAIIIGLITGGPSKAIIIIIAYFLIQQFENNIIVPFIMGSVAETHPLVTILLIMLGQFLLGPIGAVLAIPIFITIVVIIKAYQNFDKIQYAQTNRKTSKVTTNRNKAIPRRSKRN